MIKFHPFLALTLACVACGASFSAGDGSGGSGGLGQAGAASGGETNAAGSSSAGDAGESSVGGTGAAGEGSIAGGGSSAAGRGGSGAGGAVAGAGGAGVDCAKLKQQYQTAVEKARVCDRGSTDQCSTSSVAEPINCGCPVLVNAKSEYTATAKKVYRTYQESNCDDGGLACDIFCAPATSASCAQQSMGPGSSYLCTAGIPL